MKNPKRALEENAARTREMHRLYPFTRTVSSAGNRLTPVRPTRRPAGQEGR